jgi:hypothetical protein
MKISDLANCLPALQSLVPSSGAQAQPGASGLPSSSTGLTPMGSQAPDTASRYRTPLPPSLQGSTGGESPLSLLQNAAGNTPPVSPDHHVLQIDHPQAAGGQATQQAGTLSRLTGALSQAGSSLRQRAGRAVSQTGQGASAALGQVSQGTKLALGVVKQGASKAYGAGRAGTVQTGQDLLKAFGPLPGAVGIAGAHLMQQAITCGIPTFAREMAYVGLTMKLAENPGIAAGLQAAMTAINVAGHVIRHRRMDRNPEAAARGFHGMTKPQWDAAPPEQQAAMMERQQRSSRWVTQMHAAAMVVNTGAMIAGLAQPGSEKARLFLATSAASDVRNLVYAAMRETGQASFSVVGLQAPNASGGVNDQRMSTSAFAYTVSQALGSYGADAILSQARPDIKVSGGIIRTAAAELASGPALFKMAAVVAGVRAFANTLGEVQDAYLGKHHEASQAGGKQVFSPSMPGAAQYAQKKQALLTATQQPAGEGGASSATPGGQGTVSTLQLAKLRVQAFRDNVDISRLLDHSPARMAWNGTAATAADLASLMAPSNLRTALSSFGVAMLFGVSYKPVNQTYQAHAAVRSQVRVDAQAQAMADQGVPRPRLDRTWLSRQQMVPGSPPPSRETSLEDPARASRQDLASGPSFAHLVAGRLPAIEAAQSSQSLDTGSFRFIGKSSSSAQPAQPSQTLREAMQKDA